MKGFPADDFEACCGSKWKYRLLGVSIVTFAVLIVILVPSSLEQIASTEVALSYDKVLSVLGDEVLTEGLRSKPTFGSMIKWPITNQRMEHNLTCNSFDAIIIEILVDILYVPNAKDVRALTLNFVDFEGYQKIVSSVSTSAIRNACGGFTAREFQTNRATVAQSMEASVRADLSQYLFTTVLTVNLRNIERPEKYQNAVDISEAALADIELAKKQEEQQVIMARTMLVQSQVGANKTINNAEAEANIMVARSEQEVKLAAKADTDLARRQYDQVIIQARTALLTASISANKTLAAARTDAEITATVAQNQYASLLDKYTKFARLLNTTKAVNNLTVAGALAYLGNTLVGGEKQQIALDAPAKFSWKNEL